MTKTFHLPEDCDPRVRTLYEYWRSIRPAGVPLPGRRHMDPLDIPKLLTHVWLADVERDPMRFRFRLVGSAIVRAVGVDLTGQYFDDCFDDFEISGAGQEMAEVAAGDEPIWRRGPAMLTRKGYNVKQIERIFLPLAADGETVDMLLGLSVYVLDE